MRFAVLGAGAIGAYVGACLTRADVPVVLVARGAHLEAMQRNGVRVVSAREEFRVDVHATDDLEAVADADCVVIGLKANSLPGLLPRVEKVLTADACLLPAQNGVPWWFFQSFDGPLSGSVVEAVDPGGEISRTVPHHRVVGCVPYPATEIVEPGVVRHLEGTRFTIGEPDGSSSERCDRIAEAFTAAGLSCPVKDNIREQIWLKLIGNVAFNPVTALTGATLGQLGELPEMVELLRAMLEEATAVGEALGIRLPVPVERRLRGGLGVGDHKTSMLQDREAGKPLELAPLTDAVGEIAGKLGMAIPHIASVQACIKLIDTLSRQRTT